MRAVAGWLGRVRGVPLAWGDRLKEYATPTRVAPDLPPPTPHHDAPPAWRAVLQGCLEPDPARRWTATRLIFGAQPPPVVDEFWLVPSGNGSLRLSWQAPAEGRVVVHDLEGRPAAGHGAVCGMAALPSLAPALRVPEGANETIVDVPAETRHLQAVTVMEPRRAVAFGAVIGLSRVPDVFAVRALPSGGRLQLTWRWPEGVDLAYVAVRDDRFAGAADEGPRLGCLRSDYEARGCFYVSAPAGARAGLFISVFAARRAAGALVYAPGATPGARARIEHAQVTLRYFVQPAGAGEYDLLLEPGAAAELPGLLLVGATDRLPLHRNDGTLLCPVEPGAHCTPGRPLARRFRTPRPGPYRARLFCQRDEDYRWLQLESVPAAGVIVA